MLSAYRVLDLTDERGQLCGQLLAMLGAEVIAVEPPGGSTSRRVGPFWHDEVGPETSLFHWSYNRGKRSVVVDLATEAGRERLKALAAGADVLVDSAGPGKLAELGLGPDDLAALNPALVTASISAFGGDGPRAGWAPSDVVIAAASGQASLTGDDDRPPLRVGLAQAYHHAAADAAGAILIALYEREHHSGVGQHIDLSAQQSLSQATQSMMLARPLNASALGRVSGGVKLGGLLIQLMWPCKDGHVSVTLLFGAAIGPFTRNLMEWIHEEGFCDEATRDKDWLDYTNLLLTGQEPISEYERIKEIVGRFLLTKTKAELLEATFERRLLIVPVTTIADVADSPQYRDRAFWQDVDHGDRGSVRYPGAIAKLSATPVANLPAAPPLGEDTAAVLAEPPRQPTVSVAERKPQRTGRPLEGLKVLDFMWVMAGPAASRVLADYGATVVRVESARRIDTARTLQPFRDDGNDPEGSGLFQNMNAGKLGLALDLSMPESREIVHDLVRWADVVLESFSPKAMRNFGLTYDELRKVKPDLVMASTCLMGQSGPHAELAGYGTMGSAMSGFFGITGWPDRAPSGPFGAYTDYVAPKIMLPALLAAIEHHRRTGEGQYVDLAQTEASMQLLAPALLDYSVNGRVMERRGNDDEGFAPHGVYPAAGDDRWLAVACETDQQWRALAATLGREDLASLDGASRRARRRELDELVSAWTAERPPVEAMVELQEVGVPAYQVQNTTEMVEDPQLGHRQHFVEVPHATQGTTWVEGTRFRLSRTPGQATAGAPTFGEHLFEILNGILGYDPDRIADLAAAELLE